MIVTLVTKSAGLIPNSIAPNHLIRNLMGRAQFEQWRSALIMSRVGLMQPMISVSEPTLLVTNYFAN